MANLVLRSIARQIRDLNVSKVGFTSFYVDNGIGDDDYGGEGWNTAFATIQKAIDEGQSWVKIFVGAGTYPETITIPPTVTHVEIHGTSKDLTIIKPAANSNGVVCSAGGCVFDNFGIDLSNTTGAGAYPAAFHLTNCSFGEIVDCSLAGYTGAYVTIGIFMSNCSKWDIHKIYSTYHNSHIQLKGLTAETACLRNHIYDCELIHGGVGVWLIDHNRFNIIGDDIYLETFSSAGVNFYNDTAAPSHNILTHNIFNTGIATKVSDDGTNNVKENYYQGWTTDTNGDGVCDSPYAYTGGTDNYPASTMYAWRNKTMGFGRAGAAAGGAGDISIWESFEYISDAALQAVWIEGGGAGNPTRAGSAYYGQYAMQTVIGGTVGTVHRTLTSYDMSTLANLTLASKSSVGGETIAFRLYDSNGYWSEWNLSIVGVDTWNWHIVSIHTAPDATHATSAVDLADVVKVELNSLDTTRTFSFDLIEFESLVSSKIGIGYDGLDDAKELTSSVRGHLLAGLIHGTGTVMPDNKSLYDVIALDRLDDAAHGLSALDTELGLINADLGDFSAQTHLQSLLAALGVPDVSGKSLYNCLVTDRLDHAMYGLSALDTELGLINADLGDFSAQTHLQSLLAALGVPDVSGKSLYNCLVTDRLDHAMYGLSALDTELGLIKTQTDKLAGAAPTVGSTTANYNAAEQDIVSIGTNDTKNKLHSLLLDINALTAAATITIRMYMQINGTERKVYDQDLVKDTDPDGVWIVNGTLGVHEVLRVTAQSNAAGDDGKAIKYDYMLEAM